MERKLFAYMIIVIATFIVYATFALYVLVGVKTLANDGIVLGIILPAGVPLLAAGVMYYYALQFLKSPWDESD